MIKSSLFSSISIILYISIILLILASPFNTTPHHFESNSSFTLNYNMQFVYAEHDEDDDDDDKDIDDLDLVCFENDNDKTVCFDDDDNIDIDDINDPDMVCFETDEEDEDKTVCVNDDDDDYDNFAFTNSPIISKDDLFSFSSSIDDHSSSLPNPIQPQSDSRQLEEGNKPELKDSSVVKTGRSSDFPDLTNPDPFSRFQDPIPPQPGQPLHPTRPTSPTLPSEPDEPRAPLVSPPPPSN